MDLTFEQLRRGDVLILCSDGLSGQVKREEFAEYADKYPALEQLCTALIDLANERGGPDNITVVAVRFDGPGLPLDGTVQEPGYHVLALPGDEPDGGLPRHQRASAPARTVRRAPPVEPPDPSCARPAARRPHQRDRSSWWRCSSTS